MARETFVKILAVALSFLLIVAGLFFSIKACINDAGFLQKEFVKLGNAAAMGMSAEDLTAATLRMVAYMEGKADTIDIEVTIYGKTESMFNERERAHMVDVRTLYQGWRTASMIFAVLYMLLLLYWFFLRKAKAAPIVRTFLQAGGVFVALLVALGAWVALDFSSFWNAFHHLFFTNDLWVLNPTTDRMINMMPLNFFYDIILNVALRFVLPWLALSVAAFFALRWNKRLARRA